jgi:hypothetical protein
MKGLERTMMRKIARLTIPVWGFSAAFLVFGVYDNFAHAQSPKKTGAAVACGKEIKKQCTGMAVGVPVGIPVQVNNVLGCLQKSQEKLSARCAAVAKNVARMCDSDANRLCSGVVAGAPGNIVGCLTMARNVVSPQCNAALDAAGLR